MLKEKQLLLDEIRENICLDPGFIILSYAKLSPNEVADFRKTLYDQGSRLLVTKKRLLSKAATELGCEHGSVELKGHVAIMNCQGDFMGAVKTLYQFKKTNGDSVQVLGGYFQKKPCTAEQIQMISDLPNLEEMRAAFLGLLEAPMSQLLAVFDALLTSVLHCLENRVQKETN